MVVVAVRSSSSSLKILSFREDLGETEILHYYSYIYHYEADKTHYITDTRL